jgi:hypothetical protein
LTAIVLRRLARSSEMPASIQTSTFFGSDRVISERS